MGLFFTLLYLMTAYLGPVTLFGPLAEYHVEIIIALITLVASVLSSNDAGLFQIPQTFALLGLSMAVFFSLIANGWFAGATPALLDFLPNALVFVFVALNCKKKIHLQLVVYTILFACIFTIARGYMALNAQDFQSPYLVGQGNDEGGQIYRLRGLSFISDPNDFSQLMVSLIPCLFLTWKKKNTIRNTLFVLLPTGILLFGMFLTHSRGAIIAMVVVLVLAGRRKLGTVPSVILGGGLFFVATFIGWSGGREISVEAGSGRMDAWGVGLQLILHHPILGVGFGRFSDFNDITAHNSVVVCAAELGVVGLFFWIMYTLPTIRDMIVAGAPGNGEGLNAVDKASEDSPHAKMLADRDAKVALLNREPNTSPVQFASSQGLRVALAPPPYFAEAPEQADDVDEEELRRMARLMTICLAGFLVAGWFLSRAYVMTLFVYGGMAQAVYRMALDRGIVPPRMRIPRLMVVSLFTSLGLLVVVYMMLRVQHLMPK